MEKQTAWRKKLNTVMTTADYGILERRAEAEVNAYNSGAFEPLADPQAKDKADYIFDKHFAEILDCRLCGNKSTIAFVKNGSLALRACECRNKRINIIRLENSGLMDFISECTFENYETPEEFQSGIKDQALNFVKCVDSELRHKWYFIGGQVGSGKTHICTAIFKGLIDKNYPAKYMMYRDEAVYLKSIVNKEPGEYAERVHLLKSVDVLYIDDLFKGKSGEMPTAGDINLVFEIINARYNNKSAITVISSEKTIDEIINIDEAIGSRIRERSRGFCRNVVPGKGKNWRLKA